MQCRILWQFGLGCGLLFIACKKDTSARDKFLGTYQGDRICYDASILWHDTMPVTIEITAIPKVLDSVQVTFVGIDSSWASQRASFGGNILDFVHNSFAGELNGDTLLLHDFILGYACSSAAVRQ